MNVAVAATDERAIEVLAGLAFRHGGQLAVDITLGSALTCCGNAELLQGDRCQFGRRGHPNRRLVEHRVARHREDFGFKTCTRCTTHSEALGMSRMLAVSCGRAFAHSMVSLDGPPPWRICSWTDYDVAVRWSHDVLWRFFSRCVHSKFCILKKSLRTRSSCTMPVASGTSSLLRADTLCQAIHDSLELCFSGTQCLHLTTF